MSAGSFVAAAAASDEAEVEGMAAAESQSRNVAEASVDQIATLVPVVHPVSEVTWSYLHALFGNSPERCSCISVIDGNLPLTTLGQMLVVSSLIGIMYTSFAFVLMPATSVPAFGATSIIYHTTFALGVWSYRAAAVTDPGRIPDSWTDAPGLPDSQLAERKRNGRHRYCNKEKIYKPDRAHFCRRLGRNVLRMDHYCPWLGNCIGFYNYKYFVLFLLYTSIDANILSYHLCMPLYSASLTLGQKVLMTEGAVLSSLISFFITPFFGFHCFLISKNLSTLEYCEKAQSLIHGPNAFPHDFGLFENIASVFGENFPLWLLPLGKPKGDGLNFARLSLTDSAFAIGDEVELRGLQSTTELNGLRGTVLDVKASASGRFAVKLQSTGRTVSVNPSNMVKVRGEASQNQGEARETSQTSAIARTMSDETPQSPANLLTALQELAGDLYNAATGWW